jgi:hypothetical protein
MTSCVHMPVDAIRRGEAFGDWKNTQFSKHAFTQRSAFRSDIIVVFDYTL